VNEYKMEAPIQDGNGFINTQLLTKSGHGQNIEESGFMNYQLKIQMGAMATELQERVGVWISNSSR
jgi:hypothetical protein